MVQVVLVESVKGSKDPKSERRQWYPVNMTKLTRDKSNSVLWQTNLQQGLIKSPYRAALNTFRGLIKDKSAQYELIWQRRENNTINIEDNKIYFNNYRDCYILSGAKTLPSLLYKLPQNIQFEEAMTLTAPVHKTIDHPNAYKPLFLGLTKNNHLLRYDNMTGQLHEDIYLGDPKLTYNFVNLNWETESETLLIQSSYRMKGGSKSENLVQAIIVMKVRPLKFVAMLELTTDLFQGEKAVTQANISEGLLIMGAGSGKQRKIIMYNFNQMLENAEFRCHCDLHQYCPHQESVIGSMPIGITVNCKLGQLPPPLFSLPCNESIVHFGGFPWHYIYTLNNQEGYFRVHNLENDMFVDELTSPNETSFTDRCVFHIDDSSRILYSTPHDVQFLRIIASDGKSIIKKLFSLDMGGEGLTDRSKLSTVTRSGRAIKKKINFNQLERTLVAEGYENELDHYYLLGFDAQANGKAVIYDNATGECLNYFNFPHLTEEHDTFISIDLDTVIITQNKGNAHMVYLYRLLRSCEERFAKNVPHRKSRS